jgi:glycosyltransferase involved in cell wall biosynthesis
MSKLSVAIPAHNEEKYIGRCIESIQVSAEQAKQQVKIAVALNRCTDDTEKVVSHLVSGPEIRVSSRL